MILDRRTSTTLHLRNGPPDPPSQATGSLAGRLIGPLQLRPALPALGLGLLDQHPRELGQGLARVGVALGHLAAGLAGGGARRDALADGGLAEDVEGLRPAQLALRVGPAPGAPARGGGVQGGDLGRRGQAGRRAGEEARVRVGDGRELAA